MTCQVIFQIKYEKGKDTKFLIHKERENLGIKRGEEMAKQFGISFEEVPDFIPEIRVSNFSYYINDLNEAKKMKIFDDNATFQVDVYFDNFLEPYLFLEYDELELTFRWKIDHNKLKDDFLKNGKPSEIKQMWKLHK